MEGYNISTFIQLHKSEWRKSQWKVQLYNIKKPNWVGKLLVF